MIVLKILLILLLVFAGLLFLILFFPLHYSIHGKSNGTWNIYADVTWLFYFVFVRAHVDLEDKTPKVVLRVLGIPITLYPRKEKKPKKDKKAAKTQPAVEVKPDQKAAEASPETDAEESSADADAGKNGKKKKNLIEKIKKLPTLLSKIHTEVLDPHNKEAVKHMIAEVKGIMSHYKPRRIRTNLVFSTGDPSTTGKLIGGLSLVPLIYEKGNRIVPDFTADKAYIEGKFKITGHVILFFALAAAVRLIMDRNIRRLIKHVKTLKG